MKRLFDLFLLDILEAIKRIKEYTRSMDEEEFCKNTLVLDAVMRNLEVIGEAANQMPLSIKEKYLSIPWRDIQDFRIVVAHKYWSVNTARIWDIVENKIDELHNSIELILQKEK